MSADKRTVATDALETLGMIIGPAEKRDAIHLAVEPVIAGMPLRPGDHLRLADGVALYCRQGDSRALGIVDPFIDGPIEVGQRFWLIIYPRQIKSLRHVWSHPAFPDEPALADLKPVAEVDKKAASERWLRNFIDTADCPRYETVIAKAIDNDSWSDEYLHFDGQDAHGEIPPEFWDHIEIVTGVKIEQSKRATSFSCSC